MTFKGLAGPFFAKVFRQIDEVCQQFGVPAYLIGAQARNIHFSEKGVRPPRGTKDIDFVIMLPDLKVYDAICGELENRGFKRVREPYRMIHKDSDTVVDLLPFGEVEEEGTVKFTDRNTELSMLGMKEVMESAEEKQLDEMIIKVPPLAGIFILKLIAYSDRPDRKKDLDDIKDIFLNYFEINEDRIYAETKDEMDQISVDNFRREAGAVLLGKDLKPILQRSAELEDRIVRMIMAEITQEEGSI